MSPLKTDRSSVLLLVDGLRPDMLGPYGNTWFDTPHLNQLAAESLLFENCISDTPDLENGIGSILFGQHGLSQTDSNDHLVDCIGSAGVETTLVSFQPEKFAEAEECFDSVVRFEFPHDDPPSLAAEMETTRMATFFAAAIDASQQFEHNGMLVLDCPGFTDLWDAPYSFREEIGDSEDPEPTTLAATPDQQFNRATDDPDLLLDYQMAYAGQVCLLDSLLGIFLSHLRELPWFADALLCLTATRGYPLGEHGVVGYYREILYAESTHVPLLVRWPAGRTNGRSHQLVQPGSLYSLLRQWHSPEDGDFRSTFPEIPTDLSVFSPAPSAVISWNEKDGERYAAIQTDCWKHISSPAPGLYVKPDDIWEFNNVASRCPAIADRLESILQQGLAEIGKGNRPEPDLEPVSGFGNG